MYLIVSLQLMPSFTFHSTTFKDCMFQPFHPNPSPGHPGITSWSLGMAQIKSFEMHLCWQIFPPASLVAVELIELSLPHPGGHTILELHRVPSFGELQGNSRKPKTPTEQIYSPDSEVQLGGFQSFKSNPFVNATPPPCRPPASILVDRSLPSSPKYRTPSVKFLNAITS